MNDQGLSRLRGIWTEVGRIEPKLFNICVPPVRGDELSILCMNRSAGAHAESRVVLTPGKGPRGGEACFHVPMTDAQIASAMTPLFLDGLKGFELDKQTYLGVRIEVSGDEVRVLWCAARTAPLAPAQTAATTPLPVPDEHEARFSRALALILVGVGFLVVAALLATR